MERPKFWEYAFNAFLQILEFGKSIDYSFSSNAQPFELLDIVAPVPNGNVASQATKLSYVKALLGLSLLEFGGAVLALKFGAKI